MSLTLAAVADALIEFILSLLRDPEVRAEFEEDPEGVLAQRGFSHISTGDVQAVAPVIIERTHVVQVPVFVRHGSAQPEQHHSNPVVREIQQVSNNFAWVDDRDTIVDQSVNQNIWAEGDVTQTFDNDAVVASGDDTIAAGGAVDVEQTTDESTTIEAGDDVNIGNDTDVTVIDDSFDTESDESTTTDASADVQVDGSGNDDSTDVVVSDSGNEQTDAATTTDIVGDVTVVDDSTSVQFVEPADVQVAAPVEETVVEASGEETVVLAPVEETAAEPTDAYTDSAAQYTELDSDLDVEEPFASTDTVLPEGNADDDF